MVKVAALFLLAIVALALIGRLRLPGAHGGRKSGRKCPACGRYRIGPGPCPCGKDGRA
jgi:hypothetical protein